MSVNVRKFVSGMLGAKCNSLGRMHARAKPKSHDPEAEFNLERGTITAEDVAGAVGAARHQDPLAVDVFCLIWWGEFQAHQANTDPLLARIVNRAVHQHADRLRSKDTFGGRKRTDLARARARELTLDSFERMAKAAVREIVNPTRCDCCGGNGREWKRVEGPDGVKVMAELDCETCKGRGAVATSDNRRSRLIGIRRADYPRYYRDTYEALLNDIKALERRGAGLIASQFALFEQRVGEGS
jgi:hypothetical protein